MKFLSRDNNRTEQSLEEELRILTELLKEGKATVAQADRVISIKSALRTFRIARIAKG